MIQKKWTVERMIDAYNDFIKKYNRLPTNEEELILSNFPSKGTIKRNSGKTKQQFIETYFPNYVKLCNVKMFSKKTPEQWLEDFKEQCSKLDHLTREQYNKNRKKHTPNVTTLCKITGVKNWNILLDKCNINKKKPVSLKVNIIVDFSNTEKIKKVCDEIYKVLDKVKERSLNSVQK